MSLFDGLIIVGFFIVLICVGLFFRRRASKGIDAYFLGDRSIPWWALGVSGMSSNVDMTGTMLIVSFFYIIGVKGFLVELRGGVVLIMAMLMVFMGKWNVRSGAMTMAEWMPFRFGKGASSDAARLLAATANVVGTIGMIAYFFVGSGKFLSSVLPFPPNICALVMIGVALFYTAISGLYGVVWIDVIQSALIIFATVFFSIKAFVTVNSEQLAAIAPAGWTNIIPSWRMQMPPGYEIYNLFGLSVMFFFFKVMLEGFGGPGGSMAQRYFAARNDRDAGLLSAEWVGLMAFRWPFIVGVAVLGLTLKAQITDPEMVLPVVLMTLVPIGLKGLLLAALMAAAMSTFDSTVNAGAAYAVKDIYQRYLKPKATSKQLVYAGYASSVGIVLLGVVIGWFAPSINFIWGWITMSLAVGMALPLVFRWFWWRFNGYGFAIGTGAGMVAAIVVKLLYPILPEWTAFIIVSSISLVSIILGTLFTAPTDEKVLINFYRTTRPFGWWKPIAAKIDGNLRADIRKENRHDKIATLFAIPWQLSLFLLLVNIVIHQWNAVLVFLLIFVTCSIGLYFFWYKQLSKTPYQIQSKEIADNH